MNDSIIVGIIIGVFILYMLNLGVWDWVNYVGFFWGGLCFLCIIYIYFWVLELIGCFFVELDFFFQKGVSVCKFFFIKVDVFEDEINDGFVDRF